MHNGKLIVGQRDGTITCIQGEDRMNIMYSHSDGEVWGLAQRADGTVVTSGDDNKFIAWNPTERKHVKTFKVSDRTVKSKKGGASTLSTLPASQCSRAVALNSDWMAVAGNDGAVSIRAMTAPG